LIGAPQERGDGALPRICLILALGFTLAILGCGLTPSQRHKLLTIFFEGVPPLDGPPPAPAEARPPRPDADSGGPPKVILSWHPPYKDKACNACHIFTSSSNAFSRQIISAKSIILKPVPILCFSCHPDKAPTPEELDGAWMHGPVAAGACTFCHNPHKTDTSFLLNTKPIRNLCQRCHESGQMHLGDAAPMGENQNCEECHTGHKGSTLRFLRNSCNHPLPLRKPETFPPETPR
jgi:predicted CXXCH cytochrome family protein